MRKTEWDFVKAVLMFIVIYGHVCPALSGSDYPSTWNGLNRVTGLFAMPLFFFISGYFQTKISTFKEIGGKYKKTANRILLPLITWGGVKTILFNQSPISLRMILGDVLSFYWFLSALIICIILGSLLSYWVSRVHVGSVLIFFVISPIIFILLPRDYFRLSFFWFYYCFGMIVQLFEKKILDFYNKKERLVNISVVFATILVLIIGMNYYPDKTFYGTSNLLRETTFSYIVLRYLLYLLASMTALYWLFVIYKIFNNCSLVQWLTISGQDTLFLYCSHTLILSYLVKPIVCQYTEGVGLFPQFQVITYYVISPIVATIMYYILQVICNSLKHSRILKKCFMGTK